MQVDLAYATWENMKNITCNWDVSFQKGKLWEFNFSEKCTLYSSLDNTQKSFHISSKTVGFYFAYVLVSLQLCCLYAGVDSLMKQN